MIKDWKCPYKRNRKKRKKIGEVHTVGKLGQVCNGSGGGPGLSSRNTENTVKMRQRQNKYAHNPLVHGMKEGGNSDDGIVAKKLLGQSRRHGRTTKNGSHGEQRREKSVGEIEVVIEEEAAAAQAGVVAGRSIVEYEELSSEGENKVGGSVSWAA